MSENIDNRIECAKDISYYAKELAEAKDNVYYLLGNSGELVDMHDLVYWASKVEECRRKIKEQL